MTALTLDQLLCELQEDMDEGFDLTLFATWIRYSYGNAYMSAMEDPEPDLERGRKQEREAWARLP